MIKKLAIKIDVDTDRGTRVGTPALAIALQSRNIPATWLWSLGPDNTGRAVIRLFKPSFFKKISRTSIVQTYGLRTLMNGTIFPSPNITKKNKHIMQRLDVDGFEHGIHCYDHTSWQDFMHQWDYERTLKELNKAQMAFISIFGRPAKCAGTPGWQISPNSLRAYDELGFDYGSDTRQGLPFIPTMSGKKFKTPQIPTTLPTLDELIGRPHFPDNSITAHYLNWLEEGVNVMTIHAEIEGMIKLNWFKQFLDKCKASGVEFITMNEVYKSLNKTPTKEIILDTIDGRSGTLGKCVT